MGLDSIATLELTAGIEETFGIKIGDEELTTALFESVDSLTEFIREKLAVQGKTAGKDSRGSGG